MYIKNIFFILILCWCYIGEIYSYRTNNIKSYPLYPIISVGNYCPYMAYGTKTRIGDLKDIKIVLDTQNTITAIASDVCTSGCLPLKGTYKPGTGSFIQSTALSGEYKDGTQYIANQVSDRISLDNSTSTFNYLFNTITTQSKPWALPRCEASAIKTQGILGLGFNREENGFLTQYSTFYNVDQVFAINLCKSNPRIWFGGFDTRIVDKEISTAPMQEPDSFTFQVKNVFIGDRTIYQVQDFVWTTRIDSRTPFLHVPSAIFHQTLQMLASIKTYSKFFTSRFFIEKQCVLNPLAGMTEREINALLPKFRIQYASDRGTSLIELNAIPGYLLIQGQNVCPGMVESLDYQMTLGIPLMRQYLVIFDQENARVGFGKVDEGNCDPGKWDLGSWSNCTKDENATCTMQHRNVTCISHSFNQTIKDSFCPAPKPPVDKFCINETITKNDTCLLIDTHWETSPVWSECDQLCGSGVQRREVYCMDQFGAVTNDSKCTGKPPASSKLCAVEPCKAEFHWDVTDWYGCSSSCGEGTQQRMINCIDSATWRVVDSTRCTSPPPITTRVCRGQPFCSRVKWDWEPCEPLCYRQYQSSEEKKADSSMNDMMEDEESEVVSELSFSYSESFDPNSIWQNMVCYNTTNNLIISSTNCKGIPNFDLPRACDCKQFLPKKNLVTPSMGVSLQTFINYYQLVLIFIVTIILLLP